MSDTATQPRTTGFDFVLYLVSDMERSRKFYEEVFGLAAGSAVNDYFVEYDLADGNTFALAKDPSADRLQCGGAMFAVPDVPDAIERVKAAGGTFIRNYGGQICDSGWCTDPDGNPFGVHKRKPAA